MQYECLKVRGLSESQLDRFTSAETQKAVAEFNRLVADHNSQVSDCLVLAEQARAGAVDADKIVSVGKKLRDHPHRLGGDALTLVEKKAEIIALLRSEYGEYNKSALARLRAKREVEEKAAGLLLPGNGFLGEQVVRERCKVEATDAFWQPYQLIEHSDRALQLEVDELRHHLGQMMS